MVDIDVSRLVIILVKSRCWAWHNTKKLSRDLKLGSGVFSWISERTERLLREWGGMTRWGVGAVEEKRKNRLGRRVEMEMRSLHFLLHGGSDYSVSCSQKTCMIETLGVMRITMLPSDVEWQKTVASLGDLPGEIRCSSDRRNRGGIFSSTSPAIGRLLMIMREYRIHNQRALLSAMVTNDTQEIVSYSNET